MEGQSERADDRKNVGMLNLGLYHGRSLKYSLQEILEANWIWLWERNWTQILIAIDFAIDGATDVTIAIAPDAVFWLLLLLLFLLVLKILSTIINSTTTCELKKNYTSTQIWNDEVWNDMNEHDLLQALENLISAFYTLITQ